MEETDRLFTCTYCRVRSYLIAAAVFHYALPSAAPADREVIYFPYWRFKGMLFYSRPQGIDHRYMDASFAAREETYFPASVGLRSQTLELRPALTVATGRFLPAQTAPQGLRDRVLRRFSPSDGDPVHHSAHIGETLSLIYAPYYVDGGLVDGVLNQPLGVRLPEDFKERLPVDGGERGQTVFLPALCPGCGWDMEGSRDSQLLTCRNCRTAWRPTASGFKALQCACLPHAGTDGFFLPFYRVQAQVDGLELQTYADLVRAANLPKVTRPQWRRRRFHFWVPAFKVSPHTFLRLARDATIGQPGGELQAGLPGEKHHPVTLPVAEALESLKITLAGFIKPRRRMLPRLAEFRIRPRGCRLVYVPFEERHHEYVHSEFPLTINRNQLTLTGSM